MQKDFIEHSFYTISSYGPHGAIIHYNPTEKTSIEISTDSTYILDSGAQYLGNRNLIFNMFFVNLIS